MQLLKSVIGLSRTTKVVMAVAIDTLMIGIAFMGALIARWDQIAVIYDPFHWLILAFVAATTLLTLLKLGLYRNMLRYMNLQVVWTIVAASLVGLLTAISVAYYLKFMIPRSVPFIFACFNVILLGGLRFGLYAMFARLQQVGKQSVLIYGAGAAGRQLATSLKNSDEYHVVGFIDDDTKKIDSIIQGAQVYGRANVSSLLQKYDISALLLAFPSISRDERRAVLRFLEPMPVKVLTIPSVDELMSGNKGLAQFKEVEIDDLLGRDPVKPNQALLSKNITGKTVMVTGAGGSIGSELCRQILAVKPARLILFELSEFSLYAIDKELKELGVNDTLLVPLLGSVQDKKRVQSILRTYKVDTIYHAAAFKHVPIVEHNVAEGVRNNVFGTLTLAKAAIVNDVETFVLISTDKAVRPTNVMGTTKRMAELLLQGLAEHQSITRFCMVRFGNVLGSSGSVVPLFRQQIKNGGPITVTHKDITRYFMTIPEASQLVIQAGAMAKGGDVFVLDMGEPVKIIDLARKLIRFSGLEVKDENNPTGDIAIECTGLRPGEKLYEELLVGDNVTGTDHPRIMTAKELMLPWPEINSILEELQDACDLNEHLLIRHALLQAPTAFSPSDEICDLLWAEDHKELEAVLLNMREQFAKKPYNEHDLIEFDLEQSEAEAIKELKKGPQPNILGQQKLS